VKLASLKGGRDGELVVVSRDLERAAAVRDIAPTLQSALDDWADVEQDLATVYRLLNEGDAPGAFDLDLDDLGAPLPRAFQFLDGASYVSHIRRNREARGDSLPDDIFDKPLVYQGISHGFLGWNEDVPLPAADLGADFEAEIAAITDQVPQGVAPGEAAAYIRLFVLLNDISLRAIIPAELKRSFGFLTGKPPSALGPVAVTPDELGGLWDGKLAGGRMVCQVRGEAFGDIDTAAGTPFHYGDLIAHAAATRAFEPGTIIALGTVSNEDSSAGFACIGERRAQETLDDGRASTPFLAPGDSVRIEHLDGDGRPTLGRIEQRFVMAARN